MIFKEILEILGTASFAISGALAALNKRLDVFGVLIITFVTAVGGGTIRDIMIGNTPVAWMKDQTAIRTIFIAYLDWEMFAPLAASLAILFVVLFRLAVVRFGWSLPNLGRQAES